MKTVKEIEIKLQNKPGALSEINELLGANGINIMALTLRTSGATGTLDFVASDPTRVVNILESAGYEPKLQEVLAVEAPHHPGGLHALLKPLKLAGVNIEYIYSCISSHGVGDRTIILLGVDNLSAAHDALTREWIQLYGEELYNY
jgi:hypothetical protein